MKKIFVFLCLILIEFTPSSASAQKNTWNELGTGTNAFNPNGVITCISSDASGNIYATGYFTNPGGDYYVVKWNGTSWTQLGFLGANGSIYAITTDAAGNAYVAGGFRNASGKYYVAKWDGTTWSELGTGANALNANFIIYSLAADANGNVYAAGYFSNSNSKCYVAKWNGTAWAELGSGTNALNANGYIYSITTNSAGNVFAAGNFTNANGKWYVAKWDGLSWSEAGTGTNALNADSCILAVRADTKGNVYTSGYFKNSNGKHYIAKWNGTSWTPAGNFANILNADSLIGSITTDTLGNLYAAGSSALSFGKYKIRVARWNGISWTELSGIDANVANADFFLVYSMATDAIGNIYAACTFNDSYFSAYVAKYEPLFSSVGITCINVPDSNLMIYPNPCQDHFTIRCHLPEKYASPYVTISLYNIFGQKVYSSEARPRDNELLADIQPGSEVANGSYLLLVTSPGMKSTKNIVIQR